VEDFFEPKKPVFYCDFEQEQSSVDKENRDPIGSRFVVDYYPGLSGSIYWFRAAAADIT